MKIGTATLVVSLSLAVLACASPAAQGVTHPAKVHKLGNKKAYVTTYDGRGRGAYVVVDTKGGLKNGDGGKSILLCAEPPPDTSANVDYSDVLKTSVDASAAYELISAAINVDVDRDVQASSDVVDVVARSELVLLMRDALYRLCEFHLNGTMTAAQVSSNYNELLRMAKTLGQRDNVAQLSKALIVAIQNKADPEVIKQLLLTIRALSFVEAAEASTDETVKLLLSIAATRGLSGSELSAVQSTAKAQYEQAVNEALEEVNRLKAAVDKETVPAKKAQLQEELNKAELKLTARKEALADFELDTP